MNRQQIYEQEIETCRVCKKQPIPQSKQQPILVTLSLFSLIYSVNIAILLMLLSFYFSSIVWKCPMCKRLVTITNIDKQTEENIIIRCGNCLLMVTKRKYAIAIAVITVLLLLTRGSTDKRLIENQQLHEIASWESLASHTGKAAILDNEHHAKNQFEKYTELGDWDLKGYFINTKEVVSSGQILIMVKMNPTQNKNPQSPDIILHTDELLPQGIKPGDQIKFRGEVTESFTDYYLFEAFHIQKTGQSKDLATIPEFEQVKAINLINLRN